MRLDNKKKTKKKKKSMNYIINKCLLAGDRFMADIHFKRSRFTYSAYR